MKLRNLALSLAGTLVFACAALAQTATLEGNVKGEDGKPLQGAMMKIDRTDIKGHYQVKTNKKGHFLYAGLPLGTYDIAVEVNGQVKDKYTGVKLRPVDMPSVDFDLSKSAAAAGAGAGAAGGAPAQGAAEASTDATRGLTPQQKAEREKQLKEQEEAMKKNKELNDAFNAGMAAVQAKQWDAAVTAFTKASELDPKQHVVWAQLAEAEMNLAATKSGADANTETEKGLAAYQKAIEIKPDDAGYHNNYGLGLAKAKKFSEAEAELTKAATLDPANAGKYYYNLGASLTNSGQTEPAGEAFKKAIAVDPNYADAHYQYGLYLLSKATTDDKTGKVTAPPETADELQKYLQLKPEGAYADQAKALLAELGSKVDTTFKATKKGKK